MGASGPLASQDEALRMSLRDPGSGKGLRVPLGRPLAAVVLGPRSPSHSRQASSCSTGKAKYSMCRETLFCRLRLLREV